MRLAIDWERRLRLMRMHTACHLLTVVCPFPITGAAVAEDDSRVDFDIPDAGFTKEDVTAKLMELVRADHPVFDALDHAHEQPAGMGPEPLLRANAQGTRVVLGRRAWPAASSAWCTPRRWRRSGRRGRPARSTSATCAPCPWGSGTPDAKHAAEVEALRVAARGLDVVLACPLDALVLHRRLLGAPRPRWCAGSCCAASRPTSSTARSASSTSRTSPPGRRCATSAGAAGERYILGTRNYTWQWLFGELQQISGVEGPAVRLPKTVALALAEAGVRAPGPTLVTPSEVRAAAHWWTYRSAKARRELGVDDASARGEQPSRRPPATNEAGPGSATGCSAPAGDSRSRGACSAPPRCGRPCRRALPPPLEDADEPAAPGGRVARELKRRGIEAEERRVPWRKSDRDEVQEPPGRTGSRCW